MDSPGSLRSFFEGLAHDDYPILQMVRPGGAIETLMSRPFLQHILQWAAVLKPLPDPIVPIFGRTSEPALAAWMGALAAGKQPTFISYPSHKVRPEDYRARLHNYTRLFRNTTFVGDEIDRDCGAPVLTRPAPCGSEYRHEPFAPGSLPSGDAPLFLQCSSGSTGLQKAVVVTTRQLEAQVASYARAIGLCRNSDRIVSWLPLHHDMGLITSFLMPMLTRTPVVLLDTFEWAANPASLLQTIDSTKATLCWLPNFAFAFLARVDVHYDLSSMRSFINCSEPVSQGSIARFVERHGVSPAQVSVCYALAENTFAATQTPIGCPPRALRLDAEALQRRRVSVSETATSTWIASCGAAIDGTTIRIDHQPGEEIGEVLLRGASTIEAYHGAAPLRTDGWFPTGDLGFLCDDELYLCGRIKDLIIHNGRNIYPQDLEEVVNTDPAVHPGRVVALGRHDPERGSETPLVLFEPEHPLTLGEKREVCARLARQLALLFDVQVEVVAVPRLWLTKTSSGKIARTANLERFEDAMKRRAIHIVGDSHVRMFWRGYFSHSNFYKGIFAHSLGVIHADGIEKFMPGLQKICADLSPFDVLVVEAGEPECRSIFAVADDPLARIEYSVEKFAQLFDRLRALRPGPLAYMTGVPTQPINLGNPEVLWPVRGEAAHRYEYQKVFYGRMREMCRRRSIAFVDACTPLLDDDGFMDPAILWDDVAHVDESYRPRFLDWLDQGLGFVDDTPDDASPDSEHWVWDGTYTHYLLLAQEAVRSTIVKDVWEPEWDHLVSGGVLDSLAIVEMITLLETTFHRRIDLNAITRHDFESLERIYERFFQE